MKFLVDEMPYWVTDCPFYEPATEECQLDGTHCCYYDRVAGARDPRDCDHLKEVST